MYLTGFRLIRFLSNIYNLGIILTVGLIRAQIVVVILNCSFRLVTVHWLPAVDGGILLWHRRRSLISKVGSSSPGMRRFKWPFASCGFVPTKKILFGWLHVFVHPPWFRGAFGFERGQGFSWLMLDHVLWLVLDVSQAHRKLCPIISKITHFFLRLTDVAIKFTTYDFSVLIGVMERIFLRSI